jgi:hypothetical protein
VGVGIIAVTGKGRDLKPRRADWSADLGAGLRAVDEIRQAEAEGDAEEGNGDGFLGGAHGWFLLWLGVDVAHFGSNT